MNLDESQRKKVSEWVTAGLKLSEIQTRMAADLGLKLTYMEVRLLVDDLKLTPKDAEPKLSQPVLPTPAAPPAAGTAGPAPAAPEADAPEPAQPAGAAGQVSISVDQIARAGAVVSGNVTFSDGQRAQWYFDQAGRLGLAAQNRGYRPSAADLQQFQMALEAELSKMGL
jgi:hypothetical protein